jgi:hypothetical protein
MEKNLAIQDQLLLKFFLVNSPLVAQAGANNILFFGCTRFFDNKSRQIAAPQLLPINLNSSFYNPLFKIVLYTISLQFSKHF